MASNYPLFSYQDTNVELTIYVNLYIVPFFFFDDSSVHNKFSHISDIVDIWYALMAIVTECGCSLFLSR